MAETEVTHQLATQKEILALWYAWRLPELGRHVGTLERSNNPLVQLAYEAIQDSGKLAAVAARPCPERDLLDQVAAYEPPAGLLELLREKRGSLPGEFFQQTGQAAVMVLPEHTDGTGEWPEPPARSDEKARCLGTVIVVKATKGGYQGTVNARWTRAWEIDEREYYFRVKREVEKAHAEMAYSPMFYYDGLDLLDVDRMLNTWGGRKKRAKERGESLELVYQVLPVEAGAYVITANQAGAGAAPIPSDRTEAFELFSAWLKTPEGMKLNRHSQGYGRQFQGTSGDGRKKFAEQIRQDMQASGDALPALHLVTEEKPDRVKELLGLPSQQRTFDIDDLGEFANRIKKLLPDLKTRSGDSAWYALHAMEACTRLRDTQPLGLDVSASRVQQPAGDTSDSEIDAIMAPKNEPAPLSSAVFGGAA